MSCNLKKEDVKRKMDGEGDNEKLTREMKREDKGKGKMDPTEDNKKLIREIKREDKGKGRMDSTEEELEERRKRAKARIEFLSKRDGSFDRIEEEVKQNPEKGPLHKTIWAQFIQKLQSDIKKEKEEDKGVEAKPMIGRKDKFKKPDRSLHALVNNSQRKCHQEKSQKETEQEIKKGSKKIKNIMESESCSEIIQEKEGKKGGKGKEIDFAAMGLKPPPPMPEDLKEKIECKGGTDMKLVIMKQLFETDLDKHQDRFSIPEKQVEERTFLEDHEKELLSKREIIKVSLIEPCGLDSEISLKRRRMNSNFNYVLISSWKNVLLREENKELLKKNDIVQLWSFRVKGKLCFALINVHKGDAHAAKSVSAAAEREDHSASSSHSTVVDDEH